MTPEPAVHVPTVYNGICIGYRTDELAKRTGAAHTTFTLIADELAIAPTLLERALICSTARELFTVLYLTGVLSHRKVEETLASILWIACKLHGQPRVISEILNAMGCPLVSDWNTTYRKVVQAIIAAPRDVLCPALHGARDVNVRTVVIDGCVKHIIEV